MNERQDDVMNDDWRAYAARLADGLIAAGDLHSPAWADAVRSVPRHNFVPVHYEQNPATAQWSPVDLTEPRRRQQWLALAYSETTVITAVDEEADSRGGQQMPVSSSTKPDLMIRMLEALAVHDGMRVLEIGTGTGYNAALLSHRLGDTNVSSVDLRPELIADAQRRLNRLGYYPTLVTSDGDAGLRERAPYNRIIATCAVPAVPSAWIDQLSETGVLLADIKLAPGIGNLILLHRTGNHAEGRFTTWWAGFMAMRHNTANTPTAQPPLTYRLPQAVVDYLGHDLFNEASLTFFLHLHLPRHVTMRRYRNNDNSTGIMLESTSHQLRATDLGQLGHTLLEAHQLWEQLEHPGWNRFGLTATRTSQTVWLDTPTSPYTWPLNTSQNPMR